MQDLRKYLITTCEQEYKEGSVIVFEQEFNVDNTEQALLYSTALGVYEIEINGVKVGQQMFAPGYTYYPRRLLYQENNVTDMLKSGVNVIRVYLGQGWYCGRFLCENKTQIYGKMPSVSWILELKDSDGHKKQIHSDQNIIQLTSPYEYAGEYDGEIYHADHIYQKCGNAVLSNDLIPETLEKTTMEVRVQEELRPANVINYEDRFIIDFGQNFAGIVQIDPNLLDHEVITIRHGELLNPDGSLYTKNLRKAKAQITYYAGSEKKIYRPRFTYMGFRYIEVTGVSYRPDIFKAFAIYTNMERTGYFECDNALVNRLYQNQVWGQKSNYVEVPTDCPQRDERMGYTGDGQVFALTGAYNYNTNAFWENYLKDLRAGQTDNTEGYVCATVPQTGPAGIGFISMLGWGNAVSILPEMLYWQYGNEDILKEQYESIKTFAEAEIRKMGRKNLWIGPSLGDWLAMGKGIAWQAMHNSPVSNAFIVHDLAVLTKLAQRFSYNYDLERYQKQLEATRHAYIKKYVDKSGVVAGDYQSAYIMALKYVINEKEMRNKVLSKFVQNVKKNGLQTGFFATQHLLPLLVEAGEVKLAYDVLLQENCPGWMYQVKHGATTTWERWDAIKEDGTINESCVGSSDNMVSFNHYAFGSVGEFYYRYILGIKAVIPGYEKVKIQPYPDERLGSVKGSYHSVRGEIKVAWKYEDDQFLINVETPVEAEIYLPDGSCQNVSAGEYYYQFDKNDID